MRQAVSQSGGSPPPRRVHGSWQDYEREKRTWQAENPGATYEQHDRACREIARRLGL